MPAMNSEERVHLLAERTCLRRQVKCTPERARLTLMSLKARLRKVEAELAALPADESNQGTAGKNNLQVGD